MRVALCFAGSFLVALCVMLIMPLRGIQAQQAAKTPRIGYLTGSALSVIRDRTGAFRDGLREFGYVDGKDDPDRVEISRGKT
jgi:hypothetical protein